MGAVAIDGDLGPVAADVTARASALWRTDGHPRCDSTRRRSASYPARL